MTAVVLVAFVVYLVAVVVAVVTLVDMSRRWTGRVPPAYRFVRPVALFGLLGPVAVLVCGFWWCGGRGLGPGGRRPVEPAEPVAREEVR